MDNWIEGPFPDHWKQFGLSSPRKTTMHGDQMISIYRDCPEHNKVVEYLLKHEDAKEKYGAPGYEYNDILIMAEKGQENV